MPDYSQHFTGQFIRWEVRGRGWVLYPEPVQLEPPFRPFEGYSQPASRAEDDGRRETFLSRLLGLRRSPEPALVLERPPEEVPPESAPHDRPMVELRLVLNPKQVVSSEAFGRCLGAIGRTREPLAFELVGNGERVIAQISVAKADVHAVDRQIRAFFPDAVITRHENSLLEAFGKCPGDCGAIFEFGLRHEFIIPLASFRGLDADPLIGIGGVLGGLRDGEMAVYQVLFQLARHDWGQQAIRTVIGMDGRPFFANAAELAENANAKFHGPLFAAVVRIGVVTDNEDRVDELLGGLESALTVFDAYEGNGLQALSNEDLGPEEHFRDLIFRRSRRTGMLLNKEELIGLAHPPSTSFREPKLVRSVRVTRAAPDRLIGEEFRLGTNEHEGVEREVGLNLEDRVRHMHILGGTGMGKSMFMLNCMAQDLREGRGFALLDPAGDLVDHVLASVPQERRDDVILFDPSDEEWPVGFNVLSARSELERNLLASDLTAIFRRQATTWGDVMNVVLANSILAFLESDQGGSLAELRRFLIEPEFRKQFLTSVADPEIRYYWEKQFPLIQGKPQASIVTRLDAFLRPKAVRHMVCQRESFLDFAHIMDSGKIFLAKLPKGLIGDENAHLFASLLVAKFQQIAMARQAMAASERRDFFLYLDEFADIRTPSIAQILAGARKYRVGLVLAHQDLGQLQRGDDQMLGAVLANCHVRVCFKLGDDDARKLADGFAGFSAADLTNLSIGEAIARVGPRDASFNLQVPWEEPEFEQYFDETLDDIRSLTRGRFSQPRELVEREYANAIGLVSRMPSPSKTEAPLPPVITSSPGERKSSRQELPEEPACLAPEPAPREPLSQLAAEEELPETIVTELAEAPVSPPVNRKAGPTKQRLIQGAVPLGYEYEEEHQVLDGDGRVDLVFTKGSITVACEICGTTSAAHEVLNIQKCLRAGFERIASVCEQRIKRLSIEERLGNTLSEHELSKVRCWTVAEFLTWLGTLSPGDGTAAQTPGPAPVLSPHEQAEEYARMLGELAKRKEQAKKDKNRPDP